MSYKVDRKKSNIFNRAIIAGGLIVALLGGGNAVINILSQNVGIKSNQDIVAVATVQDKQADLSNIETTEEYTPKYDITSMQEKYPDAWGILEKPDGTALPIAQTDSKEDESYFLRHTLDGSESTSGTVFLDHQNDKNMENQVSRLWGHNLLGENMFGDLTEYQNQGQSFYDQNKTYTLYTANGVYKLDVFAALEEDATTQEFDYNTQEEFLQDMYNNINSSNFESDVTIEPDNQVIILECCTDQSSDLYGNKRFAVYTKVTPIYEYNLNKGKTL